jgi:mRNA-degrading endonuclease RelE of RelBE toxin-antitoxin system
MERRSPFALVYADAVKQHLRTIDAKYHSLIQSKIKEQLQFEPETETRNRKPLKRPVSFGAQWEIQFGPDNRFRVFYLVDREKSEVRVLAIAVKERNRLLIGGEEFGG